MVGVNGLLITIILSTHFRHNWPLQRVFHILSTQLSTGGGVPYYYYFVDL